MKYNIETTVAFDKWFKRLKDNSIKNKLLARFARLEKGHFGDFKVIQKGLSELRFFFGGGLRIYYTLKDGKVIILLQGGDKSSQTKDITHATELLRNL